MLVNTILSLMPVVMGACDDLKRRRHWVSFHNLGVCGCFSVHAAHTASSRVGNSNCGPNDMYNISLLDPCCGSGTIPFVAHKLGVKKEIWATDIQLDFLSKV